LNGFVAVGGQGTSYSLVLSQQQLDFFLCYSLIQSVMTVLCGMGSRGLQNKASLYSSQSSPLTGAFTVRTTYPADGDRWTVHPCQSYIRIQKINYKLCCAMLLFCIVCFRDVVLVRIEKVMENVVMSLSNDSSPTIVVANTGTWNNVRYYDILPIFCCK